MGKRLPPDQLALYKRIDEILWEDWDPIGVSGIEEARDEYQSYLPGIFRLALERCGVDMIADHLHLIERQAMGMSGNRDHCVSVGRKIREERIEILGPV